MLAGKALMQMRWIVSILIPVLLFSGCTMWSEKTVPKEDLDWKTVEAALKVYLDAEDSSGDEDGCFARFRERILDKVPDRNIGRVMTYNEDYSQRFILGTDAHTSYDRTTEIFLYCLDRFEKSPDSHNALKILNTIEGDLHLDGGYAMWFYETQRELRRRCAERGSLDWKTVEGHLKQYYANLDEDGDAEREARLGRLEEAVLEKSSDERIGEILVYIRNPREELGVPAEYGEEPSRREQNLYLTCLWRLRNSPDCHKALAVLESIRNDLHLDAAYSLWYRETEAELRERCAETEK